MIEPAFNRHVQVKGSFDAGLTVQVIARRMRISGNPVKYLTGQNVIGTDDIWRLVRMTYQTVKAALDLAECEKANHAIATGDVKIARVDCTFSYYVGNEDDVRLWLRAMSETCHVRYRGRGHFDDGMASLIFGLTIKPGEKPKGSKYSSFKFYAKAQELKKRPLRCNPRFHDELHSLANGHVRAEALFRHRELVRYNLGTLERWNAETSLMLNRAWIEKMEIAPSVELTDHKVNDLPHYLRATYLLWKDGADLRGVLARRTFYRHRKELMAMAMIDIATKPAGQERRVVPILRVIEARPACVEPSPALFERLLLAA
ncbi:MAG: phage/plasmid replication protein, II/X family [Pseudomonadota bacterium]